MVYALLKKDIKIDIPVKEFVFLMQIRYVCSMKLNLFVRKDGMRSVSLEGGGL